MMKIEKQQTRLWAKRMHTALKCYKENLIYLFAMEKKILAYDALNKQSTTETNTTVTDKEKAPGRFVNFDSEDELVDMAENLMEKEGESENPKKDAMHLEGNLTPKSLLDEKTTDNLTRLKDQIFIIHEFRELFLNMLKDFDQSKMSK